MKHLVHVASLRDALNVAVDDALKSSDFFEATDDPNSADIVLVDAPHGVDPKLSTLLGDLPERTLCVVLSTATGRSDGAAAALAERQEQDVLSQAHSPWLILRCAPLGQEILESLRYLYNETIFTSWAPAGAAWLDIRDVLAVLEVAVRDEGRRGVAYDLTGPEVVTMQQICELVGRELDSTIFYVELEEEQHAQAMVRVGRSQEYARRRVRYLHLTTQDDRVEPNDTVERALGRPPRALVDYLLEPLPDIAEQARRNWG